MSRSIEQFADAEALSRHGADLVVAAAQQAVDERGRFLLALSGGGTPQRLYELLAQFPHAAQMPWQHTHLLWADERAVPPDAPGSNYRQVRDTILANVTLPVGHVHRVLGERDAEDAASAYTETLTALAEPGRRWPRLDLALLGMGGDGHTASLFPGSDPDATAPVLAVSAEYDNRPSHRVTLTPAVLNDARRILFLVTGARKSEMVRRVLTGPTAPRDLPAQRIQPRDGTLTWLLDAAAGRLL